jgi:hypothetical protein
MALDGACFSEANMLKAERIRTRRGRRVKVIDGFN